MIPGPWCGSGDDDQTFRLRRSVLAWGIVGLLGFAAIGIGCGSLLLVAQPEADRFAEPADATNMALMGMIVFGGMAVLGGYSACAAWRQRISFTASTIELRTAFFQEEVDCTQVEVLVWRSLPAGGRVDCYVAGRRVRFDLDGYADEDRLQIIRLFRACVAEEKQQRWPQFCQHVALPLRDRRVAPLIADTETLAARGEVLITRSRYDRLAAVLLPSVSIVTGLVWWFAGSPIVFSLLLLLVFFWLLLRFSVRPGGELCGKLDAVPESRQTLLLTAAIFASFLLPPGLQLAGIERETSKTIVLIVLLLLAPLFVASIYRLDRQRKQAADRQAATAPLRWREGEKSRPLPVS